MNSQFSKKQEIIEIKLHFLAAKIYKSGDYPQIKMRISPKRRGFEEIYMVDTIHPSYKMLELQNSL